MATIGLQFYFKFNQARFFQHQHSRFQLLEKFQGFIKIRGNSELERNDNECYGRKLFFGTNMLVMEENHFLGERGIPAG